jgi:hypothetical protein
VGKCGAVRQATVDSTIWRKRFEFWINKATNTNSEYVILTAVERKQWSLESASTLRFSAHHIVALRTETSELSIL